MAQTRVAIQTEQRADLTSFVIVIHCPGVIILEIFSREFGFANCATTVLGVEHFKITLLCNVVFCFHPMFMPFTSQGKWQIRLSGSSLLRFSLPTLTLRPSKHSRAKLLVVLESIRAALLGEFCNWF